MNWIGWGTGAIVAAALIACGASANAPGDESGKGDGDGDASVYDAGGDYLADGGSGGDGSSSSCGAVTTVENCGACGNACLGMDASSDNVSCSDEAGSPQCAFSCQGEHYDVNRDASDGCERVDAPIQNHSVPTATVLGSVGCNDGDSAQNLSGVMPSDDHPHENPGLIGFDPVSGSAPDYWTIIGNGSGTPCENDLNLTLTVTGSKQPSCYTLTATTSGSHGPYSCTPSTDNTCAISNGSGSYDNKSTIVWHVSRTCLATGPEDVSYTITGHL